MVLVLEVLQERGPQLQPKLLLRRPPKPSSGLQLGFLPVFLDLDLVPEFPDLDLAPGFLDLALVLEFQALGQVQYLDPWLQLKQPNMGQEECLEPLEGWDLLAEQVSQVVWPELDLLPWLLPPRLLPKLPSLAWGQLVGSELEDLELEGWGLVEFSQELGSLEVCPQLQQLKQPNMELQQDLASDCLLFSQVAEPGGWELAANLPSPSEGP